VTRPDAEALFRSHADSLFRYLTRMAGDHATAEDVLQDTFQRLLERPPRTGTNLRGWLFTVATHRLRDVQRAGRRRRERATLVGPRALSDPPARPDEALDAAAARSRVRAALDALPERDRTVLLMREEGFRHREIAEAVGTTTGSVGTLIARALDRFAAHMEGQHAPT